MMLGLAWREKRQWEAILTLCNLPGSTGRQIRYSPALKCCFSMWMTHCRAQALPVYMSLQIWGISRQVEITLMKFK